VDTVRFAIATGVTEIVEEAFAPAAAALVAVTIAVVALDTLGAVNNPLVETVPAVVLHLTSALLEPCTAANSCWVAPEDSVVLAGVTVTVTPVDFDPTVSRSPRSV
jgi:hypothetical protein